MSDTAESGRILVVDDEPQIRRLISLSLTHRGYSVQSTGTGEEALARVAELPLDLVILDLGLPDMDGLAVCRQLREWSDMPVIILSVRGEEKQKVLALDAGADDYVTKPFGMGELAARIRSSLRRRNRTVPDGPVTIGPLTLDLGRRLVTCNGESLHLTPTEYGLLRALTLNAGCVVTHRQLLRDVRGPAYEEDTPILRVHMASVRRKLGIQAGKPGHIVTEPGVGYRMAVEE